MQRFGILKFILFLVAAVAMFLLTIVAAYEIAPIIDWDREALLFIIWGGIYAIAFVIGISALIAVFVRKRNWKAVLLIIIGILCYAFYVAMNFMRKMM